MPTPAQIQRFLDDNAHRFDLSVQYLGTEPNAARKPWGDATVRWCLMASWTYEQAAGNSSIPAVYKAVNIGRADFLCDRFYLPNTPRDLRLLEKAGIPVFGIETKHQLADFDVVGSSISYPVLSMSYVKMLSMSGIPVRWRDREAAGCENFPMVIVGGQSYGAPETLAPVVDCWWLGEVEDEPGNPGIAAVTARIAALKAGGWWHTDRVECYRTLAREFNFLYFPRFVDVHYDYTDRSHVGVGPHPSKQVVGYTSNLDGMRLPFTKRHVKDLDKAVPLDDPPLLYADPAMGSGDLEVGRGCPAWCSFCALCLTGSTTFITKDGVRRLDSAVGEAVEAWTSNGWQTAEVGQFGVAPVNRITFAPAHLGRGHDAQRPTWGKDSGTFTVQHEATALHRWPLADGTETHHLKVGDLVRGEVVREVEDQVEYEAGRRHGHAFGDGRRARARANSRARLKEYPVGRSPEYVRGFIEGWADPDGSSAARREGRIRLNTQRPDAGRWLRENAAFGGWAVVGITRRKGLGANDGTRTHPALEIGLSRASAWEVVAIEEGVREEPVYCATVPGEGFFTLASGCYTGNTYRQKPYRQRSVANIVDYAQRFANNMGSVRMAPFSPDFPMYTRRKELIARLLSDVSDEVDAPTMRVDDFIADSDFILLQVHGGMDSVTLGVEGNSQRMRDLLGKGTSDAEVKEAVTRGIRAGIRKFKLFMITNLPGEDEGDIYRILKLGKELADIRESMNRPRVRIQFSWTPLMIEANTPMQWFAPTVATRLLGDVWEEFRDLKIDFKLGAKAQPDKMAFFQLCQRASRDVGEALVDAMEDAGQATWGGFPRTFKALLEAKLHAHGFRNGYADCFDERFKADLFGWEFIDQGVSTELLWAAYLQMREFIEQTDSHTYDTTLGPGYHGNEWIQRCDERCMGKACGVCDFADLKIRKRYLDDGVSDMDIDFTGLALLDQRTQAMRVRARISHDQRYRFVGNDHWRFAIRRAAFRAQATLGWQHGIAKRSICFASDEVRHRDWTCGVDYVEFAFTRPVTTHQADEFVHAMNAELGEWMRLLAWAPHPAQATTLRSDVDLSLSQLELDIDAPAVLAALARWHAADHIPMRLRIEGGYFAPAAEQVNAKDFVEDLWLARDGHRLLLRMLVRGRPNPYNVYAALMGRSSWLEDAKTPAYRLDVFIGADRRQQDFLRPTCAGCGLQVPTNVLDEPWDPDRCPRCRDEHDQILVRS